ncbi:MAG: hypothetical protein R2813_05080 [Flavobacteriales bacterium]
MVEVLQIVGLALLASVKFLYGPTAVYLAGYGFVQTLLITTAGGFFGVFVFFYAGEMLMAGWRKLFPRKKPKKKFTKGNRAIIKVRASYGLYGLAFITPCIISIPVGCLLAARFYDGHKLVIPLMFASVVFWSIVLTSITFLVGPIFG